MFGAILFGLVIVALAVSVREIGRRLSDWCDPIPPVDRGAGTANDEPVEDDDPDPDEGRCMFCGGETDTPLVITSWGVTRRYCPGCWQENVDLEATLGRGFWTQPH